MRQIAPAVPLETDGGAGGSPRGVDSDCGEIAPGTASSYSWGFRIVDTGLVEGGEQCEERTVLALENGEYGSLMLV